jgi:hypothetical protein
MPRTDGLNAGADAGRSVDGDDAIRALPGAAQETAAAMILEAARERHLARGAERRPNCVPLETIYDLAVEREANRRVTGDPLALLFGQAFHSAAPDFGALV